MKIPLLANLFMLSLCLAANCFAADLHATGTEAVTHTRFDFDGDGKADLAVFRPSEHNWYIQGSAGGYRVMTWGIDGDKLAPADYDGDGKTDIAIFRPSTGVWYVVGSSAGFFTVSWGAQGDLPMPADYDGDGKADIAVFRPSNANWYRVFSSNGQISILQFGTSEDKPVVGDYDGDGKADIALARPSNGFFYLLQTAAGYFAINWRSFNCFGCFAVPGDYDGNGRTDIAVSFGPGSVDVLFFPSGIGKSYNFGQPGFDIGFVGDFDGDRSSDIGSFHPANGTWRIFDVLSFTTIAQFQFGQDGDIPVQTAYQY